jgi:hypothetical protein
LCKHKEQLFGKDQSDCWVSKKTFSLSLRLAAVCPADSDVGHQLLLQTLVPERTNDKSVSVPHTLGTLPQNSLITVDVEEVLSRPKLELSEGRTREDAAKSATEGELQVLDGEEVEGLLGDGDGGGGGHEVFPS